MTINLNYLIIKLSYLYAYAYLCDQDCSYVELPEICQLKTEKGTNIYSIIFVCASQLNLWFSYAFLSFFPLPTNVSSYWESDFCIFRIISISTWMHSTKWKQKTATVSYINLWRAGQFFVLSLSYSYSIRLGCDNYLWIHRYINIQLYSVCYCITLKSVKRIRFWENKYKYFMIYGMSRFFFSVKYESGWELNRTSVRSRM